jgi:hypothetical protein
MIPQKNGAERRERKFVKLRVPLLHRLQVLVGA